MIKDAYVDLFALHGDSAWTLDVDALITFFRQADQSSGIVGSRQANTFRTLAALSGHGEVPSPRQRSAPTNGGRGEKGTAKAAGKPKSQPPANVGMPNVQTGVQPFGLTVRIEVNLPADATQETYDKIFQSVRKNLIDGK
jgi:Family of unknown function (DUF5343)